MSAPITITTANANPTVSITTPSGTVKGQVVIAASPLADPAGTATLSRAGIKIAGLSSYSVELSGRGTPDYSSLSFDSAGTADYAWSAGNGNYQFSFDTTPWPNGSYVITVFTKDSNGRSAVSAPITITLPKKVSLTIRQVPGTDNQSSFDATLSGASSVEGGNIVLALSDSKDGTYRQVGEFSENSGRFKLDGEFALGSWVRAELKNSPTLIDANSNSVQILGSPKLKCEFNSSGKIGSKITGKCKSSINLVAVPVQLETNIGKGWAVVAKGTLNGASISPSVTPRKAGKLKVRLISNGVLGRYGPFSSNIVSIQVSAKSATKGKQ